MKLSYRVFSLPKSGSSAQEYEDAFAPPAAPEGEVKEFRCAAADGATETSFSGLWARLMCEAFVDDKFDIEELQAKWLAEVSGKELPWYAEEKLASGAFATIIGLQLKEEKKSISWTVRALGDSCFFAIRENSIQQAIPLSNWEDFNYNPALISTRNESNTGVFETERNESGSCKKGDILYLMTDAISKWFLHRNVENGDAVEILEAIENADQFAQFVEIERSTKTEDGRFMMPNDDVTWTRVAFV